MCNEVLNVNKEGNVTARRRAAASDELTSFCWLPPLLLLRTGLDDLGHATHVKHQTRQLHNKTNIIKRTAAMQNNIRLKPWITSISRNMTADIALQNINKVVRVQTDCISFTDEMKFDNSNLILEDKTTGLIQWKNVNCYHNKTTEYKSKNYV